MVYLRLPLYNAKTPRRSAPALSITVFSTPQSKIYRAIQSPQQIDYQVKKQYTNIIYVYPTQLVDFERKHPIYHRLPRRKSIATHTAHFAVSIAMPSSVHEDQDQSMMDVAPQEQEQQEVQEDEVELEAKRIVVVSYFYY